MSENLFEAWDLDPAAGPQAITERLRELAEGATPREQDALRRAWEQLTVHPRHRIDEALATHPETRVPIGRAPRPPRPLAADRDALAARLAHASVAAALGPIAERPTALPALEDDPLLAVPPRP